MNWYDTVGAGSTTGAGNRLDDGDAMNGNAIMYDAPAKKILTAGGSPDYEDSDARTNAYVVTIHAPKTTPSVTKTQNMAYVCGFANGVILPDDTVFVTGGQTHVKPFQGGGWLCGARTQFGGVPESNHFDAEIFVPPYLLHTDGTRRIRPVVTTVAATVKFGAKLDIETDSPVTGFSLIRYSSVTHSINTDQRRIPFTSSGTSHSVTIPADPGIALPGYWLLFAINADGTPSVGKSIQLTL